MNQEFRAETILSGLRDFQRDTVDHVFEQFYKPDPSRHFLVADETGLGKSMVARGIIARTIEHLQQGPPGTEINIVYICSNIDLARQNLERLNVTDNKEITHTSRLTLLATHNRRLDSVGDNLRVPVNLVSLTPDTSFKTGQRTGRSDERQLLFLLLDREFQFSPTQRVAALTILQGSVASFDTFERDVAVFEEKFGDSIDPSILEAFVATINAGEPSIADRLFDLMKRPINDPGRDSAITTLIADLRYELAHASVNSLAPDLVIMDEFQRFTELMDETTSAGELARHLFAPHGTRVLLLSATPYKPFTEADDSGADHYSDFTKTIDFLAEGSKHVESSDVMGLLEQFRNAVVEGQDAVETVDQLRIILLSLMCRVERPTHSGSTMVRERRSTITGIDPQELLGYAALRRLAKELDAQFSVDYWKSVPYFVNFMSNYQFGRKYAAASGDRESQLLDISRVDTASVRKFGEIEAGNARTRRFRDDTVEKGWEKLLWIPPSLPYLTAGGPFADPNLAQITKRLVFSSWSSTPPAVASVLSYHAEHRLMQGHSSIVPNDPDSLRAIGSPLEYRGSNPQMSTLALFWPMPHLATMSDPLALARDHVDPVDAVSFEATVAERLKSAIPYGRETSTATGAQHFYWSWPMHIDREQFDVFDFSSDDQGWLRNVLQSHHDSDAEATHEATNLDPFLALAESTTTLTDGRIPPDLVEITAKLAAHSPANCAWRSLKRLRIAPSVAEGDIWGAAATIASGLRSTFNRWQSAVLLRQLYPDLPYWRQVLQYCADGNLQAVLDEYLGQLTPTHDSEPLDVDQIYAIANSAAEAMSLRVGQSLSHDPIDEADNIRFRTHLAVQYGGKSESDESFRPALIRHAFNSPFWPFIVISTSAGQEGIDFHPWCHHVVHWNTPSNPVDFEQRDGRVNRFRGHAVRRNLVERHRISILGAHDVHPWTAAYAIPDEDLGGLVPDWIYSGSHKVIRELMPYELSIDGPRLEKSKAGVALYRLAFGQPRQEDLIELLQHRDVDAEAAAAMRLDLTPPSREKNRGQSSTSTP
ncbi:helicase [Rhodococcus sp. WS3]|uniref:helicase-related protein n=1 Tax=Rhodococcus sp. WS3 TaxID=2486271 RepID=UPI0011446F3B|nr:helicase-related protein [Rhodococcus sp. WS3]ROZ44749.1 helicase [Rhodococcus sp. WS3]